MNGGLGWRQGAFFAASLCVYAAITALGSRYAVDVPSDERPMLTVLALYGVACLLYFAALWTAAGMRGRWMAVWVVGTSLAFRLALLPSPPFQEIDIYRYLWDGAVVAAGHDPYAYPPARVVAGLDASLTINGDQQLETLVAIAQGDEGLEEVVRTIHYADLPSPYPPVSQAVFAAAAATTPSGWTAEERLTWLKAWLVAFDLATLLLVIALLRITRMPVGWATAYGWCPLVLKEVAGSGHLDAIATFFATAALAVAAPALVGRRGRGWGYAASLLLGLGVGAKLYPVVLAPLLALGLAKRFGVRSACVGGMVFVLTIAGALAPMLWPAVTDGSRVSPADTEAALIAAGVESLPPPASASPAETAEARHGKTAGIAAFLKEWEMNDLLFMIVYENLRWHAPDDALRSPWFDVTPHAWSESLRGRDSAVFAVTRGVTGAIVLAIALWLAWRSSARLDGSPRALRGWLEAAFLTLAWFWLLAPTQNPWYWCWAVPLLPFAHGRAWLAVSALGFGYYLRFWLETHRPEVGVAGTPYNGELFFYYVVPWFEFGPVLLVLAVLAATRRREVAPSVAGRTEAATADTR